MPLRFQALEPRLLFNAGDLDLSFSGDGWATFNVPGYPTGDSADVAVQAGGKIILAGNTADRYLTVTRLNIDGSVDPSFGGVGTGTGVADIETIYPDLVNIDASAIAIGDDNSIFVVGTAVAGLGTIERAIVAKFDANGVLDPSFSFDGMTSVDDNDGDFGVHANDVALQNDGKIVVAGYSENPSDLGDLDMAVLRFNPNGSLDTSFDGNGKRRIELDGYDRAEAVAIDFSDNHMGTIVVAGSTQTRNEVGSVTAIDFAVARLTSVGSNDFSFGLFGRSVQPYNAGYQFGAANAMVIQPSGNIVLAGNVSTGGLGGNDFGLMRFTPNGEVDTSFGSSGRAAVDFFGKDDFAFSLLNGSSGRLIVGGHATATGTQRDPMAFACFSGEGFLDYVFSQDAKLTVPSTLGYSPAYGMALSQTGIVATGGYGMLTTRFFDRKWVTTSIGSFDPNGAEAGPNLMSFIVARLERYASPQRVYLNIGGTALAPYNLNADYSVSGMTVVHPFQGSSYVDIPANQTYVSVTVRPWNDTFYEGDETITFSIADDPVYDIGTPPSTTLVIRDDDVVVPAVKSAEFRNLESPQSARFVFTQDVGSTIDAGDFVVSGPLGDVPFSLVYDDISNTADLIFSGVLPDGNYAVTVLAAGIRSSTGSLASDYVLPFFVLGGDATHDRHTDTADFNVIAENFGSFGKTFAEGNLNYDPQGVVDSQDLNLFIAQYGSSVPTTAPLAASPPIFGDSELSNASLEELE